MSTFVQNAPRPSPCNGVCKLDERHGWCLGCGRTGGEIAAWRSLDEAGREAIRAKLPARLQTLEIEVTAITKPDQLN